MREDRAATFWAEMSACEHFVQIYEADDAFMDTLAGFVAGGLSPGHSAVVIATPAHAAELERRLRLMGLDVDDACEQDRFILLDARETLSKFMVNGWPDDGLFRSVVAEILDRATQDGRKVR